MPPSFGAGSLSKVALPHRLASRIHRADRNDCLGSDSEDLLPFTNIRFGQTNGQRITSEKDQEWTSRARTATCRSHSRADTGDEPDCWPSAIGSAQPQNLPIPLTGR